MKNYVPFIVGLVICISASFAGYDDGLISKGEYEYGVEIFDNDTLIVDGGGADVIETWDFSYLEVRSTSIPINDNWYIGGITNIFLDDYTYLLYLGGSTEEIALDENATASLKGGRIDGLTCSQKATTKHVDLYCHPGWEWVKNDKLEIVGISGKWEDQIDFNIKFKNRLQYGADPTWMNVNVIEVPEPASLLILCFGGLVIRRKK